VKGTDPTDSEGQGGSGPVPKINLPCLRPCDWPELEGRLVVIAGYGPVGRGVASDLLAAKVSVTIIELNLNTIERLLDLRRPVIFGDCTDPEILRRAGVEQADALVLTIPDPHAALVAVRAARQVAPSVFIAARANHLSEGMLLMQAGANHVTVEEMVTAQAMQTAVVEKICGSQAG